MSYVKFLLLALLLISSQSFVLGQEPAPQETSGKSMVDFGLEGMLGVSVGPDFYAVNVGGPSLFLNINPDWKVGVGALPSLYVYEGKLGARLGVAPRVDYRKLAFFVPFFHMDSQDQWVWSVGMGYKFH
ncbi:hypothetical protein [Litoribacter ruber]|uniref:hypothetical protein n=1 Tax=Litoribacter ruber TaxID=702568 RepID=UPI001FE4E90D|nr:hypothetical protein [Litoribacter alkaliphilus]